MALKLTYLVKYFRFLPIYLQLQPLELAFTWN